MKVIVRRVDRGISARAALFAASRGATLIFDCDAGGALVERVAGGASLAKGGEVTLAFTERRAARLCGIGAATVTHEIACGASFDGGATFSPEMPLEPSADRAVHSATLAIPENAGELLVYAHVQAIAIGEGGERIVVRDAYDNPAGAFTHYAFAIG